LTAESVEKPTPQARRRFRVRLRVDLAYTVDAVAADEDQARDIAVGTETKGEPGCLMFGVDETAGVREDDDSFTPVNACVRCKGVIESYDRYPHCPACIEAIKPGGR